MSADPEAADAYQLGWMAREAGVAFKDLPPEMWEEQFTEAWQAGWTDAHAAIWEAAPEWKGAEKYKPGRRSLEAIARAREGWAQLYADLRNRSDERLEVREHGLVITDGTGAAKPLRLSREAMTGLFLKAEREFGIEDWQAALRHYLGFWTSALDPDVALALCIALSAEMSELASKIDASRLGNKKHDDAWVNIEAVLDTLPSGLSFERQADAVIERLKLPSTAKNVKAMAQRIRRRSHYSAAM